MCIAVFVVYLLRRPIRAAFHAQIAYGLWLLVPIATLASFLPPYVATPGPIKQIKLLLGGSAMLPKLSAPHNVQADWSWLFFAAWLVGAVVMAVYLLRLQRDFYHAERAGDAGPAVVGFFRPRIVVPAGFEARFSAQERAAILAHERAHLARQDARVNALAALLRCLCWFNPLMHLASAWLRRDQELACDAAALRHVPRLEYANALLKAQMPAMSLPLGCAWPGSEHPLTERVALLKRQPPTWARRWTGVFMIALVSMFGGLGAWAAQGQSAPAPAVNGAARSAGLIKRFAIVYSNPDGTKGPVFYMSLNADKSGPLDADGSGQLSGNVTMQFPYGRAQADRGTVTKLGTITLTNNVKLLYANQDLRGRTLIFEARSGMLDLDGKQMPSGMPKQVH